MDASQPSWQYNLRPATASDAIAIRRIIYLVQINPMSLDWHRFIVAVGPHGQVIGCGQVKPHTDGSLELASLAVLPEWRGQGVARHIIEHLLNQYPGRLYLTCRSPLETLYQKFGFQTVEFAQMPPHFRRLSRLASLYNKLTHQPDHLSVMRRN